MFDQSGAKCAELFEGLCLPGNYEITFIPKLYKLVSGTYIVKMVAGDFIKEENLIYVDPNSKVLKEVVTEKPDKDWIRVSAENSISSYKQYLRSSPNSSHTKEAEENFKVLIDAMKKTPALTKDEFSGFSEMLEMKADPFTLNDLANFVKNGPAKNYSFNYLGSGFFSLKKENKDINIMCFTVPIFGSLTNLFISSIRGEEVNFYTLREPLSGFGAFSELKDETPPAGYGPTRQFSLRTPVANEIGFAEIDLGLTKLYFIEGNWYKQY